MNETDRRWLRILGAKTEERNKGGGFRWQIELVFERLKSLLRLEELPAKDPDLARTFLYSKLLAALLLEELTHS